MSGSPAPPALDASPPAPPPSRARGSERAYAAATSIAARRWACLLLIAGILAVDVPFPWEGWGFGARALMDEPCHLATGLICLGAITRVRRRPPPAALGWALLAASVLLDLDHLPQEFGSSVLTAGTPRPYTHALWVVAAFALAAGGWRLCTRRLRARWAARPAMPLVLAGCACGVTDHLLRDIAYAPVPMWWPATDASVQVPYPWYAVALVVVALVPVRFDRTRKPLPS